MNTPDDDACKAQRAVQSVEVGGRLLLALAANTTPLLLKDLAAEADLPASRAHPYLVSFCRLGLVRQDRETGRYALGPAALQLGLTALHQLEPVQVIRPIAETLAADTGQAVAVAIWGNMGPTVIRIIEARHPLHVAMRVGTVMSVFGTATGQAFAGVMRTEEITAALSGVALGLPDQPRAARSPDHQADIQAARGVLKKQGCARAVGNPIPGVNAFSAPVFDFEQRPALVLTLFGREDQVPAAWSSPMATALKRAAAQASAQLGHHP